jgi:hypothetical protein
VFLVGEMGSLKFQNGGEPLWLSGKVVKMRIINEFKRTRVRYPPRATSYIKKFQTGAQPTDNFSPKKFLQKII